MDKTSKIILVIGATGQQGGATARHLLSNGWPIRALTRDPHKPAAQALTQTGAEVVQGDIEDRASLDAAMRGVYGVFSVQSFWDVGVEGEERQGKLVADAAKAAKVQHFVYSSVGGAERSSGVPHFESKWHIEQHVRALSLPATILRPVGFMDNHNWQRTNILNGTFFSMGLRPDKGWQMIAVDDIGGIAALVFERHESFIGTALEIAGDELTEPQIVETLSRVIGRPVQLGQRPPDPHFPSIPEQMTMIKWANETGYQADIPALRALYPPLMTYEAWLRKNGWENAQPLPQSEPQQWGRGRR